MTGFGTILPTCDPLSPRRLLRELLATENKAIVSVPRKNKLTVVPMVLIK